LLELLEDGESAIVESAGGHGPWVDGKKVGSFELCGAKKKAFADV